MRQSTDRARRLARTGLRVDLRSKVPAYRQIAEQVRALAASGALRAGDRLPTVRRLADEAHIHFNTVARAYRLLDRAGVISTQHGRGTYVVAPPASGSAHRTRTAAIDFLARQALDSAARLGCGTAELHAALDRAEAKTDRPRRRTGRRSGAPSRPG
jgi:GntR family transcriptional regulator